MSGHNKFSKIKRLKAKTDAQKSKIFSKMAKMIQVEAKKANGNLTSPSLKVAIEKAKSVNMPAENIERAVKKAMGADTEQMEQNIYEAYGPGGAALIIDVLTTNRNKAAAEIKHILTENDSSLATPGSASWAFEKVEGEWIPKTTMLLSDEDAAKLEKLIDDLEENEDVQDIYTNAD
jgi:YebC/PmpR family DNA-binding regulatory protein